MFRYLLRADFRSGLWGLCGFLVAGFPGACLWLFLEFERGSCSPGNCASTGLGWLAVFGTVVSVPVGGAIALCGLLGFLRACFFRVFRSQFSSKNS